MWASQVVLVGKEPTYQCRRCRRHMGQIPGLARSPGGENGNPLRYSCLENSMDRGVWQATILGVTKSQAQLKRLSMHASFSMHTYTCICVCVCVCVCARTHAKSLQTCLNFPSFIFLDRSCIISFLQIHHLKTVDENRTNAALRINEILRIQRALSENFQLLLSQLSFSNLQQCF